MLICQNLVHIALASSRIRQACPDLVSVALTLPVAESGPSRDLTNL